MSDQVDSVTESPNHWCAISCAIRVTLLKGTPYVLLNPVVDDRLNIVLVKTMALEFSIPPKRVAPTISASFSYGYGATVCVKNSSVGLAGEKPFSATGLSECGT